MFPRILFLDFDGVICVGDPARSIQQDKVDIINRILTETDAKIVISSDWRISGGEAGVDDKVNLFNIRHQMNGIFNSDDIIGVTPVNDFSRAEQILQWLQTHDPVHFAIIDDQDLGFGDPGNFFKTDPEIGVTDDIANDIIKHLNQCQLKF